MKLVPVKPVSYYMLVRQVVQENKSSGGIIMSTEEERKRQQQGFPIFEILAQGEACYKSRDGKPFPEGPWCKVGDVVLMDGYPGKTVQPKEFETKYRENEEALKALKRMESLGLNFHVVRDDMVMGVYEEC